MKKIVALLLLSFSAQAGVTLDWEINLYDNFPTMDDMQEGYKLSNGDYWVQVGVSTNIQGSYNIVIDKDDGSYKFISEYMPEAVFYGNLLDGVFVLKDMSSDNYLIYYLDENNLYQSVEIDGSMEEGLSIQKSIGGNIFYTQLESDSPYLFSIIRKYTITSDNPTPTLSAQTSSGFNQDNFVLNWDSSSGTEYQIQSSTDLTNWVNVGSSIVGTGETMTWANHVTNSQAFYRVVED